MIGTWLFFHDAMSAALMVAGGIVVSGFAVLSRLVARP